MRAVRSLRLLSWAVLLAGAAGAILLWVSARETSEVTRVKIALGFGSLILGAYLSTLGRVIAGAHQEKDR